MRISDWSSDVCSSDLLVVVQQRRNTARESDGGAERGLVPDEGIEPPTFGLQNRCSTAELIRLAGIWTVNTWAGRRQSRPGAYMGAIPFGQAKGLPRLPGLSWFRTGGYHQIGRASCRDRVCQYV